MGNTSFSRINWQLIDNTMMKNWITSFWNYFSSNRNCFFSPNFVFWKEKTFCRETLLARMSYFFRNVHGAPALLACLHHPDFPIWFLSPRRMFICAAETTARQLADRLKSGGSTMAGQVTVKTESWNSKDGVVKREEKTQSWGGTKHYLISASLLFFCETATSTIYLWFFS